MLEKQSINKLLQHVIAIVVFLFLSIIFFKPVFFENKTLSQHDVNQFVGASEDLRKYYNNDGESSEWTGGMFSGMPAYQIGVWGGSPNVLNFIEQPLKALGGSTAGPLFAAMLICYIVFILLGCNMPIAMLGAISYGFASYNLILIDAGHINKVWNLAYMPLTIGGFLLLFKNKYILAAVCMTIGLALQIKSNHIQMTYYTAIVGVILFIYFTIVKLRSRQTKDWFKVSAFFVLGAILALLANSSNLYTNYEMSKTSTRGPSELIVKDGSKQVEGLDKDYVFGWSYGVSETMTFLIPDIKGGSSVPMDENSHFVQSVIQLYQQGQVEEQMAQNLLRSFTQYWGDQPSTSGPVYFGAVVMFLFLLGMTVIKNNLKWLLFAISLFFILLSWGTNFDTFNNLFYLYFPLYNKFRAVSQTLVIPSILFVVIAVWGLMTINKMENKAKILHKLYWLGGILGGICLVLWIFPDAFFTFLSQREESFRTQLPTSLISALISDRRQLLSADALRSLVFILFTALGVWVWIKFEKMGNIGIYVSLFFAVLILVDLWGVDKRYLPDQKFVSDAEVKLKPSIANQSILKDKSLGYRVFNLYNPFAETTTSYFHRSIGGYHAAKLQRYQQLIENRLSPELSTIINAFQTASSVDSAIQIFQNTPALNMLNMQYIIYDPNQPALENPYAMGNAWFVDKVRFVDNPNQELESLDVVDVKKVAIIDQSKPYPKILSEMQIVPDSTATIQMTSYKPNLLTYKANVNSLQLAVFSEVYYADGWKAYIDGVESAVFRVDWILRGLVIPEGEHEIVFKFEPKAYRIAKKVETGSSAILILLIILTIVFQIRKKQAS